MLGLWRTHQEYQDFLVGKFLPLYSTNKERVEYYATALAKLYLLDLDPLKPILETLFSPTGKPAKNQPEIFRSFVLMSELRESSITNWVRKLKSDALLCHMIGVAPDDVPGVGNHYDFINRLWLENPDIANQRQNSLHPFKRKPTKKLGKNQKQPPRHPGIIQKLVDFALQGKTFESRPEILMQQIFAKVIVEPSANQGLLGNTQKMAVSGDGTCINTGGSSYGIKVCDCVKNKVYNCDCQRRFSDPQARHGWDSYHEQWFYGYTGYFLSVYNPDLQCDLPLYLRLVEAQRFDGVSAIVALAEAKKLYPDFSFDSFFGDSAHDNYPTYQLLNAWHIKAFIPLNDKNKGHFKFPPPVKIDENGVPICIAGFSMVYDSFLQDRCRIKWRCPLATGKVDFCPCKEQCSPSSYGRTVYTKPEWDLRLFTAVPRGSDLWKQEMKNRTTSERVNKRILVDYGLEKACVRGKKRWSWRLLVHSANLHLDARLKVSGFCFIDLLDKLNSKAA